MESTLQIMPVQRTSRNFGEFAEDATIVVEESVVKSSVSFLDANTNPVTLEELTTQCVVPTWANQELTIAHQDFISCVHDAASSFYAGETVNAPDIRCSHIVRGRTPQSLGKKASELLECEKTQFYQRLAFAFTIPTIYETVNGQKLELCVGGVRNYSDLNLYRSTKGLEKFSVFIGCVFAFVVIKYSQEKELSSLWKFQTLVNSIEMCLTCLTISILPKKSI